MTNKHQALDGTPLPACAKPACRDCALRSNRRRFLTLAGLGAMASWLDPRSIWAATQGGSPAPLVPPPKAKIFVFYSGGAGAWPKPEFDAPAARAKYDAYISEVSTRFPDVEFLGRVALTGEGDSVEQVKKSGAQGILCIKMGPSMPTWSLATGLPLAIYDAPFSIHEWMYIQEERRAGKPIVHLPSRDWKDIDFAVNLLKTAAQMRQSRILMVSADAGARRDTIKEKFGCEVIDISTEQAVAAHQATDKALATELAESLFLKPARTVVEPTREEVIKSAQMYLAMRQMLKEHQAHAITVNCLGGIPINVLGYPCLGFAELCDLGYPGVCEADLDSALTMLMFQYGANKPGFITDPLFDLSKNSVIHAHCVARREWTVPVVRDTHLRSEPIATIIKGHLRKLTCVWVKPSRAQKSSMTMPCSSARAKLSRAKCRNLTMRAAGRRSPWRCAAALRKCSRTGPRILPTLVMLAPCCIGSFSMAIIPAWFTTCRTSWDSRKLRNVRSRPMKL